MRNILPLIIALALVIPGTGYAEKVQVGKSFQGGSLKSATRQVSGLTSAATRPSRSRKKTGGNAFYSTRFHNNMRSLAAELTAKLRGFKPERTKVVVTTFVPVGSYEKAESFGRLCAQQMVSGLSEHNFRVQEIKKMPQILVQDKNGFFVLSNKLEKIGKNIRTDLVLAGTYAMVRREVLISAVLMDADSGDIVSTGTLTLDLTNDTFLTPLIAPLISVIDGSKNRRGGTKNSLTIREPVREATDATSKKLALKIDKLSRDISRNVQAKSGANVLIVSTFVDMDRLSSTNTFGRYIAEELMIKMSQRGFKVIEIRTAKELMIQPNIGEMALSRNAEEMMNSYEADAMVVGSYKKLDDTVVVHARMIVAENQEIISFGSMEIKADSNDKFMQAMFQNSLNRVGMRQNMEGF